jgi:LysM repeat protein
MEDDLDNELDSFRKAVADDDLGHRGKSKTVRRSRWAFPFKPTRGLLILAGAGILFFLILVTLFSRNSHQPSADDLGTIQARLDQLEETIHRLEGMEAKLLETIRTEASLNQQLQRLTEEFALLEKGIAADQVEAQASLAKPSALKKPRYHEVRSGDTLFQIAAKYGLTLKELCRLNHMTSEHIIHPGQRLLVNSGK